jgi:FtsP/CotA-like multicopper oxidase with cupredoxin domain
MVRIIRWFAAMLLFGALFPGGALANVHCPRPLPSSEVIPPPDLFSKDGVLKVSMNYWPDIDQANRTLFCFSTADAQESPTLHVNPGDTIKITLTNRILPFGTGPSEIVSNRKNQCGDRRMTLSSVNIHFHGVNTSPKCHSDEVIHTIVNSGQTFEYKIKVPTDEPPGLYWYHPHVHGISSMAVQGGASGAIIVEGIENIQPAVAGLPERLIIIRDQPLLNSGPPIHVPDDGPMPNWDVNVNYVPVPFPGYPSAIIKTQHGTREFWRIANAAANTILDLQVLYDKKAQPLQVVAFDGVPTGSQDGKRQGTIVTEKHLLIPPAGRVEFILNMPNKKVAQAYLVTRAIKGGPASDTNPARTLAQLIATDQPVRLRRMPERSGPPNPQRFEGIDNAKVTAKRTLFFSEVPGHANKVPAGEPVNFFITVDGQSSKLFDPNDPPAIVTTKGAVEDWTIQNRTFEVHEFHMHQIHFKVLEVSGVKIPKDKQQWYDTYQVDYWNGEGRHYPYIKVRMDFRGAVVGDSVYHCHILDHEDGGMMAIIRVKPPKKA